MKVKIFSALVFLLVSIASLAQENTQVLDLFQATDNPEERESNSRQSQSSANRLTSPAFTLVGTSRFGDEYYASLVSRSGEAVQIQWEKGTVKQIEGYLGFSVADVNGRQETIRHPSGEDCVEAVDRGVKCNENFAVLSLTNATPIEGRRNIENNGIEIRGEDDELGQSEELQINGNTGSAGERLPGSNVLARNPFSGEPQTLPNLTPEEQAAREERRLRRAETFRNFEIVRIPDNEIPEGMERIRTPFGDRLEPSEE